MAFEAGALDVRSVLMAAVGGWKDASMCRRWVRGVVGLVLRERWK